MLPVVGGVVAYFYSNNQAEVYEAKVTLLVQQRGGGFSPGVSDFRLSGQLASTYGRLVRTTPFLSKVSNDTELPVSAGALQGMIAATTGSNPPTLDIRARSSNPELAATVASVVAREFIDFVVEQRLAEIARLQAAAATQGISNVPDLIAAQFTIIDSLSVLEPVVVPSRPILPRTRQNVLLGAVLGAMLALAGALLLASFSDTVRDPDEIRRRFGINTLGTIFRWSPKEVQDNELVLWKFPASGFSESFRQIRANLQFATSNRPNQVLMVSSPGPGEGKSTTISNLAIALAQTGKSVLVLDGDLRRPSIHRRFVPSSREPGLSNLLSDMTLGLSDVMQETQFEGISIVPGGPIPPNPSELFGPNRMSELTEEVRKTADVVLVDTPPVLVVADGAIIASQVDGAIIVVDGDSTRPASLKAALDALSNTEVKVIGLIVNKLKRVRFGYGYSYPYYYQYDYYRYGYSESAELDGVNAVNGTGPIYRRPLVWAQSALSKLPKRGGRSQP